MCWPISRRRSRRSTSPTCGRSRANSISRSRSCSADSCATNRWSLQGAVARTQVEETKLELEGLRDRRAALDTMRREPVPLIAPVSGVIAEGTPITGQIAQSNAVVFQIVTPANSGSRRLSFEPLRESGRASAKTGNGSAVDAQFRGSGLADRSQSIPVHFAIEATPRGCAPGSSSRCSPRPARPARHRGAAQRGGARRERTGIRVRACQRGTLRAARGANRAAGRASAC